MHVCGWRGFGLVETLALAGVNYLEFWMLFGYYSDTLYRWYLTLLAGDGIAVGGTRVTLILHAWPDGPKRSASGRGMFW